MTEIGTETYFRQLCEHLGVSVVATDGDLKIRIWNRAASRMFGAASEQMQGVSVATIFPQEVRERATGLLRRAFETGEIISFEFQHADAQGERRELISTFATVVSESGARIGASDCIRDITHRIALQSELDQSRKMAALGTLAGGIAHHFNNILGGIITSVDFAGTSDDLSTMARVLRQTGQALTRASRLVNGLLAFSEGDQHADDLSDFSELIFTLIDGFEAETKEQGVDLQVNFPRLPVLPVAGTQVMTILRNITRNALEAMHDGGKKVIASGPGVMDDIEVMAASAIAGADTIMSYHPVALKERLGR